LIVEFLREVGSNLAATASNLSIKRLGRQMNVIGGSTESPFPKNVGLLFFNDAPQKFFPATQIDVVWFPDGAGGDRFEEKVFQGPLARITRDAIAYIERSYVKETVVKHPDRPEAERFWNFPRAAFEEAVVNAVYHRSYEVREPMEVRVTPEEIVVLSFPGPDRSISMEDLQTGKAVSRRYRNRRIGEFLLDFEHPERNRFHAINQFRVDTPGCVKAFIVPDIVLFVNGIPLVVIEAKIGDPNTANPMYAAFEQLLRYRNGRGATLTAGLREGEPRLFYTNLLMVRTCGEKAEFGTITSGHEHFHAWKDIWPEERRAYTPPLGTEREQEKLIQGLLAPDTLLDVLRTCTVFMDTDEGPRIKVVCRYQQYRAARRIVRRLREGTSPESRSGVIWHTQGSGKSLTMVFVARMIRSSTDLQDFKILLVNDRTDLERQLSGTAKLIGGRVNVIESTSQLRDGRFTLRRDLVERGGTEAAKAAFRDFYVARGQARFDQRVAYFAPKVGMPVKAVHVRELGNRWASCSTSGVLSFHWKCMMAPLTIVDYIVVHELCHLRHRDHTDAFWNEVDKVMPDCLERKEWLRRNGAGLDV